MRTDATIDRKYVRCPNCRDGFAYDKSRAQVGDLVWFTESGHTKLGRMIGRIAYAPSLDGEPCIQNYILCAVLSENMTYMFERWVNPVDVTRVTPVQNQADVMRWFMSDEMIQAPIPEVRRATSEMWSTLFAYRQLFAKRASDMKDYLIRYPNHVG